LSAGGPDASPNEQAGLYADWSRTAYRRGQLDRATSLATTALELATHASDAQAQARAHNMLGVLNNSRGDRAEARRHLEASISLLDTTEDPGARAAALNNLALVYSADGDVEQARQLVESALTLCVAQGDRHREAALHSNLADLLHAAGNLDAAMSHFEQAAAIFADIGAEAGALQPEIWMLTEW
jgi:tetratricopeptide (TPR) repeat protein